MDHANSYTHKHFFGARPAAKLWKGADLMEPPRIQAKCVLCSTATHMCKACSAAPQRVDPSLHGLAFTCEVVTYDSKWRRDLALLRAQCLAHSAGSRHLQKSALKHHWASYI